MTLDYVIIGVLTLWCAVIIAYQCFTFRLLPWVWRWDVFRVLPSYRLFTDVPRDLRLFVRDRLAIGTVTPWQELALSSPRHGWHGVWHPERLVPHVRSSLVENLVAVVERQPIHRRLGPEQTVIYRGLVHALHTLPDAADPAARQFRIVEGEGFASAGSTRIVFTSNFHPL